MLVDILKSRKCFKLVCGAGNEDAEEIEKLVAVYSQAGANFFDLSAKEEVVKAAKKAVNKYATKNKDFYFCVSVGIKGDPHVSKAKINLDTCSGCQLCVSECPQKAIPNNLVVDEIKCIGCKKCSMVCPTNSISFYSKDKDLREILPPLIEIGIDCIELHALGTNEEEVLEKWNTIMSLHKGVVSVCLDRSKLGNEALIKRVKRLNAIKGSDMIIQADGAPMSGGKDDFKTTLQTVACAEIFQNENIAAFILLSGGTNSKTTELAKMCGVEASGVAIGSYARKIIREYIDDPNFWTKPELMEKAVKLAKSLVDTSLEHMG